MEFARLRADQRTVGRMALSRIAANAVAALRGGPRAAKVPVVIFWGDGAWNAQGARMGANYDRALRAEILRQEGVIIIDTYEYRTSKSCLRCRDVGHRANIVLGAKADCERADGTFPVNWRDARCSGCCSSAPRDLAAGAKIFLMAITILQTGEAPLGMRCWSTTKWKQREVTAAIRRLKLSECFPHDLSLPTKSLNQIDAIYLLALRSSRAAASSSSSSPSGASQVFPDFTSLTVSQRAEVNRLVRQLEVFQGTKAEYRRSSAEKRGELGGGGGGRERGAKGVFPSLMNRRKLTIQRQVKNAISGETPSRGVVVLLLLLLLRGSPLPPPLPPPPPLPRSRPTQSQSINQSSQKIISGAGLPSLPETRLF